MAPIWGQDCRTSLVSRSALLLDPPVHVDVEPLTGCQTIFDFQRIRLSDIVDRILIRITLADLSMKG